MGRVTHTFGSSVGHHNLMQVVGAHTRGNTEKQKELHNFFCSGTSRGYTIVEHFSTHIKEKATSSHDEGNEELDGSVWTVKSSEDI